MFTAALFTTAKIWKPPKCALTDKWIKKIPYVCIYLYIGILLDHKKERNLHIMLSQRNQRKTNIVQFHLHVKSKKKKKKHQKTKTGQIENRTESERTNRWLPEKGGGGCEMSQTCKGLRNINFQLQHK